MVVCPAANRSRGAKAFLAGGTEEAEARLEGVWRFSVLWFFGPEGPKRTREDVTGGKLHGGHFSRCIHLFSHRQ